MKQPALYIPHGGGPWPFVETGLGNASQWLSLRTFLEGVLTSLPERPKAILCISAHWEEKIPTVLTAANPPMLYDYYGFPQESYEIQWPAATPNLLPGWLKSLLLEAGLTLGTNPTRGFDHGAFVPLKLIAPYAEIPTTQLSLLSSLDPAAHIALGKALAPLREEGVLILGSGMSSHNLRALFHHSMRALSIQFDDWLQRTVALPPAKREKALVEWAQAPAARENHPREEHLLPLHVVAGAGHDSLATIPWNDTILDVQCSAVRFG